MPDNDGEPDFYYNFSRELIELTVLSFDKRAFDKEDVTECVSSTLQACHWKYFTPEQRVVVAKRVRTIVPKFLKTYSEMNQIEYVGDGKYRL